MSVFIPNEIRESTGRLFSLKIFIKSCKKRMKSNLLRPVKRFIVLLCLPGFLLAADLETESYLISIESNCEEGEVSCNDLIYTGTSKKSGNTITLKGSTWHTLCADGVTPCRFLGYKFENCNTIYYIRDSGLLEIIKNGDKILVSEQGIWK